MHNRIKTTWAKTMYIFHIYTGSANRNLIAPILILKAAYYIFIIYIYWLFCKPPNYLKK